MQINCKTLFYSAIAGALLFGVFICLLYGVAWTSASAAGFLQSTTVVIVPILQTIISKKAPQIRIIVGVVVVTIGLFLMNGGSIAGINAGAYIVCFPH